jgi:hypothetical protein
MTAYHAPPRSEHSAVLYTSPMGREIMIVYGGRGNNLDYVRGDVMHFDVESIVWSVESTFRNVSGHSAVLYDGKMYVFGGWDGAGYFYEDLAVYDVEHRTWTIAVTAGGTPTGRRHGSFVLVQPHADDPTSHYAVLVGGFKLKTDVQAALDAMHNALVAAGKSMNASADVVHDTTGLLEDEKGEWTDTLEKTFISEVWRFEFSTLTWTELPVTP